MQNTTFPPDMCHFEESVTSEIEMPCRLFALVVTALELRYWGTFRRVPFEAFEVISFVDSQVLAVLSPRERRQRNNSSPPSPFGVLPLPWRW